MGVHLARYWHRACGKNRTAAPTGRVPARPIPVYGEMRRVRHPHQAEMSRRGILTIQATVPNDAHVRQSAGKPHRNPAGTEEHENPNTRECIARITTRCDNWKRILSAAHIRIAVQSPAQPHRPPAVGPAAPLERLAARLRDGAIGLNHFTP